MGGCFGQYGTLFHDTLEKYLRGELEDYELLTYYKNNFDKIVTDYFPPNKYVDLREKYYKQGIEYFSNFDGFEQEPIEVEKKYYFKIGDFDFTGIIDMEVEGQIIDHKTKGEQHLKRLTKKHIKDDYVTMLDGRFIHKDNFKQLYIYSIPYKEKYNISPQKLSLNMVRIGDWYSINFNEEHFEEAKQWTIKNIEEIYKTEDFVKCEDSGGFWCNCICGQRLNCPHSDKYLGL